MACDGALQAAAPVKLNAPLVSGGSVYRWDLQISPDSSLVLYTARQESLDAGAYVVPIGGGTPLQLNAPPSLGGGLSLDSVLFSTDGTSVIYSNEKETGGYPIEGARHNYELLSAPIGGGTPTLLYGPVGFTTSITATGSSPDSSRVVFLRSSSKGELYSVPLLGGPAVKLNGPLVADGTVKAKAVQFTPDSSRVIYTASEDTFGMEELYSVPAGGGTSIKLNGPLPAGGDVFTQNATIPLITPDGTHVVYMADQETYGQWDLCTVPITGGSPLKLNSPLPPGRDVGNYWISPDGSRVLFMSNQGAEGYMELYSVPTAGGTPVKLSIPVGTSSGSGQGQFSPDSSLVLYDPLSPLAAPKGLYVVPSGGGASVRLVEDDALGGELDSARFSPDGNHVVFRRIRKIGITGYPDLYSVPTGGGTPVRLSGDLSASETQGVSGMPDFSPDGSRVLYISDEETEGVWELFLTPTAGGTPVKVNGPMTPGGDVYGYSSYQGDGVQFSSTGDYVIYVADQDVDEDFELYSRLVQTRWSGGSGSWSGASNWAHGVLPDEVMHVVVDSPGTVTLAPDAMNPTVNDLLVGGGSSVLDIETGASLTATNGAVIDSGGTVVGEGTIIGDVRNAGVVSPGSSPGAFSIDGTLTQESGGTLQIELAAVDRFDQLLVTGAVNLGGTLNVEVTGGFVPQADDSFDILDWTTREGTFAVVNLPVLPSDLQWDTSGLYTNGVLAVAPLLPGDYNEDGVVDAADYTVWRDNLDNPSFDLPNEGATEGVVTEEDCDVWKTHFGETSGSGSGANIDSRDGVAATVPEPSTLLLAVLGIAGYLALARRAR
jgi:Tol biopolymer transport system component